MASVSQSTDTQSQPHIEASTTAVPQATDSHLKPDAQRKAQASVKPRKPRHRNRPQTVAKSDLKKNGVESVHFTVVVTGFPEYAQAQDLFQVLKQFGPVIVNSVKNGVAKASYATESDAQKAVQESNKVAIYGELLNIRPLTTKDLKKQMVSVKNEFVRSKQKTVIIEPTKINLNGDFHSQLDNILSAVRLNQEQVMALSQLYTHLQETLQALWPGCKAIPFGSIPTGLGIKTSDADCFILVPPAFRHQQTAFVMKAKRLLQQHPNIFAEILAIPGANTPIVKFFHVPTETNCDISFKTPLGARNSELIAFLLHADRRLIPMSVLIKYWAKVHDLSGTGRLTNYALTLLIIFYLQQPPISILPSVQWLQRDSANDEIVDCWNTGFMRDHSKLPPNTNTSSIAELIGGFFQYYSTFNFNDYIISPYLGIPVKKNLFKNVRQLPPDFERYKQNVLNLLVHSLRYLTAMCVQDPFEQCHNVASPISTNLADKIKTYFQFAANAYELDKLNGCQNFLKMILLEKPKFQEKKHIPEHRVILFPNMLLPIINPDWKSVVREAIFTLFETIFKLKLEPLECEESKKVSEVSQDRSFYKMKLTKPIWNRKGFTRLYEVVKFDFIQKQAHITEEIIQSVKHSIDIELQVSIVVYKTRTVVVTVKLLDGDIDLYRNFGRFYSSVMQNWIREILKPHVATPVKSAANAEAKQSEGTVQSKQPGQSKENAQSIDNVRNTSDVPSKDNALIKENAQSKVNVQNKETVLDVPSKENTLSEEAVQSKGNVVSEENIQNKEKVRNIDTVRNIENVQNETNVQSNENIHNKDIVQNEETIQSNDNVQNKETIRNEETVQSNENVQNEETVRKEETVQRNENVQNIKTVQKKETVQINKIVPTEDFIESEENIEDENCANGVDESQTQSDDYQSCDETKTNNDEKSNTMNITSLEKLKIT